MSRPDVITISDNAAARIKALMQKADSQMKGVRLSVNSKGCSGLAYHVEYASEPQPGDEVVESKGVTVYVDPGATLFILGTEMDYVESKLKSGFEFHNPNETGRCGCGESFHVDREQLAKAMNAELENKQKPEETQP